MEGLTGCAVDVAGRFAKVKTWLLPERGVEACGRSGDRPLKGVLVCLRVGKSSAQHARRDAPSTERSAGNCSMHRSIVLRFWSCKAAFSSFAVGRMASMIYA